VRPGPAGALPPTATRSAPAPAPLAVSCRASAAWSSEHTHSWKVPAIQGALLATLVLKEAARSSENSGALRRAGNGSKIEP
jgi:hypothetical protein